MTHFRMSFLRIVIGVVLILCVPYLLSAGSARRAQGTWDRLRAASAIPSAFLSLFMLYEGAKGIRENRRRCCRGKWALSQVQEPTIEVVVVPLFAVWVCLEYSQFGSTKGVTRGLALSLALFLFSAVYVGISLRRSQQWLKFISHTVCEDCGYIVDGVEGDCCPECGRRLAETAKAAPFGRDILLR